MATPLPNPFPPKRPPTQALVPAHSWTRTSDRLSSYIERLAPTEVDLLTAATGKRVVCLAPDWPHILGDLFSLGYVRLLTAGTGAFVERYSNYPSPEFSGSMAVLFDETMELRHDLTQWGRAFVVFPASRSNAGSPECGLHFFDRRGTAMHRIFLSSAGSIEALERIAEEYGRNRDDRPARLFSSKDLSTTGPDEHPGQTAPRNNRLLRRVQNSEVMRALQHCHHEKARSRISIGNAGSLQTYRGTFSAIHSNTFWTCVMDRDTVLYIRDAEIAETWIVHMETEDGEAMSLTAFAANGRPIVTLCSEALDSLRSDSRWNHLLESSPDA